MCARVKQLFNARSNQLGALRGKPHTNVYVRAMIRYTKYILRVCYVLYVVDKKLVFRIHINAV